LRYISILQHNITDCGAACLAIICKQYGYKKPISQIREIAGTDKEGTNAFGLLKAAKELGLSGKGVKGSIEDLTEEIPLPAIAHIVKDNLLHYVVIHRIKKDKLLIANPAEGLVTYTKDEFSKIWSGVLLLITPNETFEKKDETKGLFSRFFTLLIPHNIYINNFFIVIIYTWIKFISILQFQVHTLTDQNQLDNL